MDNINNKKLTNRQINAMKTKKKILDTTLKLISDKGFDNVGMLDIAKKAGVATGTFYLYYKSKDDILLKSKDLFTEHFEKMILSLDKNLPYDEKILYLCKKTLEINVYKGTLNFVKAAYGRSLLVDDTYDFMESPNYDLVKNEIVNILNESTKTCFFIDNINPQKITSDLFTIINGIIYDWFETKGDNTIIEDKIHIIEIYINSLKH